MRVVTGCADGSMAAEIVSADTHLKAAAVEEQGIALVMSRTRAGELLRAMRVLGSEFADGRCLSGDPEDEAADADMVATVAELQQALEAVIVEAERLGDSLSQTKEQGEAENADHD